MLFCKNCGEENSENAKACIKCGDLLKNLNVSPKIISPTPIIISATPKPKIIPTTDSSTQKIITPAPIVSPSPPTNSYFTPAVTVATVRPKSAAQQSEETANTIRAKPTVQQSRATKKIVYHSPDRPNITTTKGRLTRNGDVNKKSKYLTYTVGSINSEPKPVQAPKQKRKIPPAYRKVFNNSKGQTNKGGVCCSCCFLVAFFGFFLTLLFW